MICFRCTEVDEDKTVSFFFYKIQKVITKSHICNSIMFIKNGIENWYLMNQQFFDISFLIHNSHCGKISMFTHVTYQIENKLANYHKAEEMMIQFFDTYLW